MSCRRVGNCDNKILELSSNVNIRIGTNNKATDFWEDFDIGFGFFYKKKKRELIQTTTSSVIVF